MFKNTVNVRNFKSVVFSRYLPAATQTETQQSSKRFPVSCCKMPEETSHGSLSASSQFMLFGAKSRVIVGDDG